VVAENFADGQADRFQAMKARHATDYPYSGGAGGAETVAGFRAMLACADVSSGPAFAIEACRQAIEAAGAAGRHSRQEWWVQCSLARDIFGSPFRPVSLVPTWLTPDVVSLAQAAYQERNLPSGELDPVRLAVLADALEEAGAGDDVAGHLRSPGPHVRGCWAVDLILGKE
jgi:hypothetical protein